MKTVYSFFGDFYHNHSFIYPAVKAAASQISDIQLIDTTVDKMEDALSRNPSAIIMGRENRINPQDEVVDTWLTPALDEKITSYVKNGGRFLAIHAALASYDPGTKYTQMLKGYFLSHPQDHCPVRFTSNETMPFKNTAPFDYEVVDEHYFLEVEEESTTVFMHSKSEHGGNYGGWYHSYGDGKVICIVPTHRKEGFEHPETVRLIYESLKWVLYSNSA
ncbi:MAG: ThuA domain-containing protein [Defluviitaleaceae bacterium]|nr:ThuA domain-containing protein [Defluviitaleaceae bacterium]